MKFTFSTVILTFLFLIITFSSYAQSDEDALFIKTIHDNTLLEGSCYDWLTYLSEEIGGRLSGSEEAHLAVEYTRDVLAEFADTVYLQECKVPHWVRGKEEVVIIKDIPGGEDINIGGLALGNSVGTGAGGVEAQVVEVQSLDEVKELGRIGVEGKIVFFNRPFDQTVINTFRGYGGAVDQRVSGPTVAASYGAIAAVVRSVTSEHDDIPHTGVTNYDEEGNGIPAIAISMKDADLLQKLLEEYPVSLYIENYCETLDREKISYNVIAEIKGSTHPEEIILVGGHLDSWDVGGGAHDDGAGCVHSMQVFETLRSINYTPKRTLRCVMFMNEENGLGGGRAYAAAAEKNKEYHMAAIESDSGGFTPRGFTCDATNDMFPNYFRQVLKWGDLLDPYDLFLKKGGSGADISPLKSQGGLLMGFRPDSQRYFDFHHSEKDNIDAVHPRELKLGAAAITSMVYLIDKYGLEKEGDR